MIRRDMRSTSSHVAWRSIAAGFAVAFAVGWNFTNVSADAPALAADYHVSLAAIGLLTTVLFLAHALLQLPAGRSGDRFGPRSVALVGMLVILSGNLAALVPGPFWIAVLARSIVGVGTGLTFITGLDHLRRAGGSALLQGIYAGTPGAAMGLAFVLVPQLQPVLHWRGAFISAAAIAAVALAMQFASPPDRAGAHRGAAGPRLGATWALARNRQMLRLAILNMASAGVPSVMSAWTVTLLVRAGGYSIGAAGAIGSFAVFGSIASRPLGGWIVHQRPAQIRLAIALSILGGAAGVAALTAARPLALALAGSALVGIASGVPWAYAFTGAARLSSEAPGAALALINMTGLLVSVAGIPLVGLTFSLPGHGRIGFAVMAGLWALSILALPRHVRVAEPATVT